LEFTESQHGSFISVEGQEIIHHTDIHIVNPDTFCHGVLFDVDLCGFKLALHFSKEAVEKLYVGE